MPNLPEHGERLLRPIQVQRLLGVAASTLWNYVQQELLKPVQYTAGGHARYAESEVIALKTTLAAKRAPVAAEAAA